MKHHLPPISEVLKLFHTSSIGLQNAETGKRKKIWQK